MSASSMAFATAEGVPAGVPVARRPGAERVAPAGRAARRSYVHGCWVGVLSTAGGSLFVLAALAALYPRDVAAGAAPAATALALAYVVTNPHVDHYC